MSSPFRKAAEELLGRIRKQYSSLDTYAPANEADFRHLNLSTYARFQSELEQAGFRCIGDVEVVNASHPLIARTMIRGMLSSDGHVSAGYYQIKPMVWRQVRLLLVGLWNHRFIDAPVGFIKNMKTRHCIDFQTEFSDGRILSTSNAPGASAISMPPSIETCFLPAGTPAATLLAQHQARRKEILAEDAPCRPVFMASKEDVLAMTQRRKALANSHRASIGWITRDELLDMAGGNERLADTMFEEVQKVLTKEQNDILDILAKHGH